MPHAHFSFEVNERLCDILISKRHPKSDATPQVEENSTSKAFHALDTGFYWSSANALPERYIPEPWHWVLMETLQLTAQHWKNAWHSSVNLALQPCQSWSKFIPLLAWYLLLTLMTPVWYSSMNNPHSSHLHLVVQGKECLGGGLHPNMEELTALPIPQATIILHLRSKRNRIEQVFEHHNMEIS